MIISILVLCASTVNPDKVLNMEDIKFVEKLYTAYFCTGDNFPSFKLFAFLFLLLIILGFGSGTRILVYSCIGVLSFITFTSLSLFLRKH